MNLRDRIGTIQNQPNITKIVKHGKEKDVKAQGAAKPK